MIQVVISVIAVVLLVSGCYYGAYAENKDWNKGVCFCGKGFWIPFDMNSQGGHGYKCSEPNCNHVTWQSWRTRA